MSVRLLILCLVVGMLALGGCDPLEEAQQDAAPLQFEATQRPTRALPTPNLVDSEEVPTPTNEMSPLPRVPRSLERVPPTTAPVVAGEAPVELLQQAIANLAGRLGVVEDEIEVVEAAAVVWRDGSLGCPQPGMMYTMALVEGYQIKLRYDGQVYDYHASTSRVFLCENALLDSPLPKRNLAPELELIGMAIDDLARRLGVAEGEIFPESVERRTWPDASLGCPQPGQVYAQIETPGYELVLKTGGKSYTYHADQERVVYCESQ